MTQDHPSLAEQIDAVEHAKRHITQAKQDLQQIGVIDAVEEQVERLETALDAAVETLKTLEFARETLR